MCYFQAIPIEGFDDLPGIMWLTRINRMRASRSHIMHRTFSFFWQHGCTCQTDNVIIGWLACPTVMTSPIMSVGRQHQDQKCLCIEKAKESNYYLLSAIFIGNASKRTLKDTVYCRACLYCLPASANGASQESYCRISAASSGRTPQEAMYSSWWRANPRTLFLILPMAPLEIIADAACYPPPPPPPPLHLSSPDK